jgi:hypothetical protein
MANVIKLLRSITAGSRPSGKTYGEPYVNISDGQLGVFDSSNAARDLIGVPFFSANANYNAGRPVNYQGQEYVALVNVAAGAWNPAQWTLVATQNYIASHTNWDALAYMNMAINPRMDISQERGNYNDTGGILSMTSGTQRYVLDGYQAYFKNASATVSVAQMSLVTFGVPYQNFSNSLYLYTGNGFTTLANGDCSSVFVMVEGYRMARLNWGTVAAQPLTYAFALYAGGAGTFFIRFMNATTNRTYYQELVSPGLGWHFYTGTIPGDTAGTWNRDTGVGLYFQIFFCGKDATAAVLNTWGTVTPIQTPNNGNLLAAAATNICLTGIYLGAGTLTIPEAALPNLMRPSGDELPICQRYSESGGGPVNLISGLSNLHIVQSIYYVPYTVTKRINPPSIAYRGQWLYYSAGNPTLFTPLNASGSINGMSFYRSDFTDWEGWCPHTGTPPGTWFADSRL